MTKAPLVLLLSLLGHLAAVAVADAPGRPARVVVKINALS